MKPYKIVIIEDEELIREELKTLLVNAGYVVDCVINFAKTIDCYYSQPIFWHAKKKRVDSDCLPAFLVD